MSTFLLVLLEQRIWQRQKPINEFVDFIGQLEPSYVNLLLFFTVANAAISMYAIARIFQQKISVLNSVLLLLMLWGIFYLLTLSESSTIIWLFSASIPMLVVCNATFNTSESRR